MHRLLAALALILVMAATGTAVAATTTPPSNVRTDTTTSVQTTLPVPRQEATVVLYGDSLAWEARDHFSTALTTAGVGQVRTETMGGTAICDWLDRMRADAVEAPPTAVVVEFSGNALTPCMSDLAGNTLALSPAAYRQKYTDDAQAIMTIFEAVGTRVYFASAPKSRLAEETADPDAGWLNGLYASLARGQVDARYVDAGAKVLRRGHWTQTLPCLGSEPCTGGADAAGRAVNVVRAPDGGHFCPGAADADRGVTGDCPVWSSGAHRYGLAMATAVLKDLPA